MNESPDGAFLAGGQTLLPAMKQRLASPSQLVDLTALDELKGIAPHGPLLSVGAMTRHADVATSQVVAERIPALARLAGDIGDPLVRNAGTLGGSVANNDPAADYPAAVLGLGATIVTDRRSVPADEFFTGMFETALYAGELILRISFPVPRNAAYGKFANPASRYAIVGVMVAVGENGVRVAVTGAAPCVFRATELERALEADFSPAALANLTIPSDGLNEDLHASAEYRADLAMVMARRAVDDCA